MTRDSEKLEGLTAVVDRMVNGISRHARKVEGFGLIDQSYSGDSVPLSQRLDAVEVREPERDESLHWTGVHAVNYNEESGNLELGVRERNPSERGHTFSIYETSPQNLLESGIEEDARITELKASELADGQSVSVEGGTLHQDDGERELYLSYQHEEEGWSIERFVVDELEDISPEVGETLELASDYPNQKDPVIIDGDMYFSSTTSTWADSLIERVDLEDLDAYDQARREIETEEVAVEDADNVRVTGGGVTGSDILVDETPNFPHTSLTNLFWNQDERARAATLSEEGNIQVDGGKHFVSENGGSARYLRLVEADNEIYLFWEEEQPSGSHSAYAAPLSEEDQELMF
jgi:hypothetical protein